MPMCVHLASDAEEVATVQANRETNQRIFPATCLQLTSVQSPR